MVHGVMIEFTKLASLVQQAHVYMHKYAEQFDRTIISEKQGKGDGYITRKVHVEDENGGFDMDEAVSLQGEYIGDPKTAKMLTDKGIIHFEKKEGDCGFTPSKGAWTAKTMEDAKQMAADFAEGVS